MYFTLAVCVFVGCIPPILGGINWVLFEKSGTDFLIDSL